MINNGEISAKIDSKHKMISFIDDSNQSSEYLTVVEELEKQNKRIV